MSENGHVRDGVRSDTLSENVVTRGIVNFKGPLKDIGEPMLFIAQPLCSFTIEPDESLFSSALTKAPSL